MKIGTRLCTRLALALLLTVSGIGTAGAQLYGSIDTAPLNVKQFGAKGDGAADDTAILNKALASGSAIVFPPGTYIVAPPTPSASAKILTVFPGQTITGYGGATIKIKNGAGIYETIMYGALVPGFSCEGMTFDHNQANNNIGAANAAAAGNAAVTGRRATFELGGANLRLVGNTTNNGQGVQDYFIGTGGAGDSVRAYIVGNRWLAMGDNPQHFDYDNSTLYVTGSEPLIQGNYFQADFTKWARSAIETHATQQNVSNNTVVGYRILANITGASSVEDSLNSIVAGNIGKTMITGINLASFKVSPHTTGFGLRNFQVVDNEITILQATYASTVAASGTNGILFDFNSDLPVENVKIARNKIWFESEASDPGNVGSALSAGISCYMNAPAALTFKNISIVGNEIYNAPVRGIQILANINGLTIDDNLLINPGQTKIAGINNGNKTGMYLYFRNIAGRTMIRRNRIIDDYATTRLLSGVFCFGVTGIAPTPEFHDNVIEAQGDGVSLKTLRNIDLTAACSGVFDKNDAHYTNTRPAQ